MNETIVRTVRRNSERSVLMDLKFILWWWLELSVAMREVIILLIKSDPISRHNNYLKIFGCNSTVIFCVFWPIFSYM